LFEFILVSVFYLCVLFFYLLLDVLAGPVSIQNNSLFIFVLCAHWHFKKLVQLFFVELPLSAGVLKDLFCHELLEDLSVVDLFFHAVIDQKTINNNVSLLTDSKCSIGCLDVDHGIPVGVKDYYFVCTFKVDAESSYFGGEEEDKVFVLFVKGVY
jgi:hypothetical protein